VTQPDLCAGMQGSGDRREGHREVFDVAVDKLAAKEVHELFAFEKAATKADINVTEHVAQSQTARPFFKGVEFACSIRRADESSHGGAADYVGSYSRFFEGTNDTDVGPTPRCAATKSEAYDRLSGRCVHESGFPAQELTEEGRGDMAVGATRCAFSKIRSTAIDYHSWNTLALKKRTRFGAIVD